MQLFGALTVILSFEINPTPTFSPGWYASLSSLWIMDHVPPIQMNLIFIKFCILLTKHIMMNNIPCLRKDYNFHKFKVQITICKSYLSISKYFVHLNTIRLQDNRNCLLLLKLAITHGK